ncbi:MAG: hypothetical protein IT347_06335 [Candidatus Eisenbacteria bacterium]|nr:hypothetical protein [Candidatus Eisenbacteria bacterium]
MDIDNKVVARYLDGRVLKGVTRDFSPNRVSFHIEVHGTGEIVELRCRHLKALFFVRSLEGDSSRQDLRGFVEGPAETAQGRKIAVRFRDDEFVCGYTLSWSPDRDGFFLFPSDAGGNNHRIFVISASTDEIKAGPQAESLAQRVLAEIQARSPRAAVPGADSPAMGLTPASVQPRPSGTMPRPASGPAGTGPPAKAAGAGGVHEAGPSPRPSATLRRPADGKPRPPASDAA